VTDTPIEADGETPVAVTVFGGDQPHTGAIPLTLNQIVSGLQYADWWWGAGSITFSIPGAGSTWPGYPANEEPADPAYAPLSAAQADRFRTAIGLWDRLIAPSLVETTDATSPGNIRIAFSGYTDLAKWWGYASVPPYRGGSPTPAAGDIWINAKYKTTEFANNSYDWHALLHELGHALGLKHSFEAPLLPSTYENRRYTIMSYTTPSDVDVVTFASTSNGGLQGSYSRVWASTPMVLDIAAIQARYGADMTTAAGDDVYTFTTDKPFLFSIYDAGGNDTFDLTKMTRGSVVDLTPGAYSSIGYYSIAAQKADAVQKYGAYFTSYIDKVFANLDGAYAWADNLGIAFSTVIENVLGSPYNDTIIGNTVANRLSGGAGNDILTGGGGNDVLDGGLGFDIAVYNGQSTDFSWTFDATGLTVRDLRPGAPEGTDTLSGIERLQFIDKVVNIATDAIIGLSGPDTLMGGPGADTIFGLEGDDRLTGSGGNDQIDGGAGTDTAVYGGKAADYAWWANGDGSWTVKDLRFGAPDGTDALREVELLEFADRTVKLTGLTPAEALTAAFENLMTYAPATAADTSYVANLAARVAGGQQSLAEAVADMVQRADATTAVASITYEFFTGATPSKAGLAYLVSPTGDNPNNLNSDYYKSFNLENRYINFAVNLGKFGDGKESFAAKYGLLDMFQATTAAYTVIFGGTPTEAKVHALLDATFQFQNQTTTRADYFAYYGKDGADGVGSKAAMVGWLLAEAVKADLGAYALSNTAYFTDLADGAPYAIDIVGAYGKADYAFPKADSAALIGLSVTDPTV